MELHFSEVDNTNQNPYSHPEKYWETPVAPKKKKVSFDDILTNMNIVVNKSGVLQFMQPLPPLQEEMYQQQYQNQNENQTPYQEQPYQEYVAQQMAKKQQAPLDPLVKNSFIFNKYFKDYKDPNTEIVEEVKVPKTIEEYNKMVLEERIKRIQERNRIAQIKSTKMLFENNNNNVSASKNTLRMMKFG